MKSEKFLLLTCVAFDVKRSMVHPFLFAIIILAGFLSVTIQAQETLQTTVSNELIEPTNPEMTDEARNFSAESDVLSRRNFRVETEAETAFTPQTESLKSPAKTDDLPEEVKETKEYISSLPEQLPEKPASNLWERTEILHDRLYLYIQHRLEAFDNRFASTNGVLPVPQSPFRFGMQFEAGKKEEIDFGVDAEFDLSPELPNIEKKFRFFITTHELDEFESAAERRLRIGIGRKLMDMFTFDVGIKGGIPPDGFASLKWSQKWAFGNLKLYPMIKGFCEAEDGFGCSQGFTFDRWIKRWLLRSSTGGRYADRSDGYEWKQVFLFGYANELIEEKMYGRLATGKDLARGGGISGTIDGHTDHGQWVDDEYRVDLFFKLPLRKRWLYLELGPRVEWQREREWEPNYSFLIGFDALFWRLESE